MEHRGIEYQVVQMIGARGGGRTGWKWSVRIDPFTSASGTEANRPNAVDAAVKAIDRALSPKVAKVKLVPRQD